MVNYYTLLSIEKTADELVIRDAIKRERRVWNQRTSNPKQEIRAEAEARIINLAEAERILCDKVKRAEYHKLLEKAPKEFEKERQTNTERDWLELAQRYWDDDDYNSMAYACREATLQQPQNPVAWFLRGVSSFILKNLQNAVYEFSEAIRFNPDNALYYKALGDVFCLDSEYQKAIESYQRAKRIDSGNNEYDIEIAICYNRMTRYQEAYTIIKEVYAKDKNDDSVQEAFTTTVCNLILTSWSSDGESVWITNEAQVGYSNRMIDKLRGILISDADQKRRYNEIRDSILEAQRVEYRRSDHMIWYVVIWGSILGIMGESVLLGIILLAGSIVLYIFRHRKPIWQWNAQRLPQALLMTGLQEGGKTTE